LSYLGTGPSNSNRKRSSC